MFKINHTELADILSNMEPVALKGVTLLRQCPPTASFFPATNVSDELVEATIEIISYTRTCEASLRRVSTLQPIPLTTISIEEFSV